MSQFTIIVLAPNGRRQTVKVSSNSTVLQILEDVCSKQGFDPQEYDLRHHSRILDTTMTVQFSRLPNNAQLEMVKAKTLRKEEEVLLSLQIESGERLSGKFFPTENLWEVISKLNPPFDSKNQTSILYMRQEIQGEEALRNTTLRSLGLTSGRALLRFMNRPTVENTVPMELHTASTSTSTTPTQQTDPSAYHRTSSPQRKTANSPTPPPAKLKSEDRKSPEKESEIVKSSPPPAKKSLPPVLKKSSPPPGKKSPPHPQANEKIPSPTKTIPLAAPRSPDINHSRKKNSLDQKILAEIRERKASSRPSAVDSTSRPRRSANETTSKYSNVDSVKAGVGKQQEPSKKTIYQSPGPSNDVNVHEGPSTSSLLEPTERNPVVYSRKMQRHESSDDLPDEFFELTIDDVKYLYRSLKSQTNNIDDSPLQTSALRKLEESKRVLNQLHKYKRTVLRIEFPDQTVLQGTFSSVETVENVYQFVREFLEDPTVPFYLYTAPPKEVLPMSAKLIEANCVPCAVLHFGVHGSNHQDAHFLKKKVLSQLSSLEAASAVALRSRGLIKEGPKDNSNIASTSEGTKERNEKSSDAPDNEKCAKVSGNPNVTLPIQEMYK